MNLVRKLLHRHISIPQFLGYFFANILGMFIVLLAVQFYSDVIPMFSGEDNFFKKQYVVVSKHIGTAGAFSGKTNVFTQSEIDELAAQPFAKRISTFGNILREKKRCRLFYLEHTSHCITLDLRRITDFPVCRKVWRE